jgi:predicted Zn finger-like uncharacterized protein
VVLFPAEVVVRCLEPAEIERYVAGTLEGRSADEATAHLATCKRCRVAVADARARVVEAEDDRDEKPMIRVQCPTCNARYGVPEERVKGRVLKIRCKACSAIIEVRGAAGAGKSVLDRGRKLWFLVVRRERVGPMTEQEVRERFARGEVKARTYGWRQGFTRWERLYTIAEFKDLLAAAPGEPAAAESEPPARGKRPTTRPLPELGAVAVAAPPDSQELDFDARRAVDAADLPTTGAVTREANLSEMRTFYHAPEMTPELRPGFQTQEDADGAALGSEDATPETDGALTPAPAVTPVPTPPTGVRVEAAAAAGGDTDPGDSRLTHVHFVERDPLAGLGDGGERSVDDASVGRTAVKPQRAEPTSRPEAARPLADGEFDRHLRGQRNDDSVLFSLNHLHRLARATVPAPRSGPAPTGLTGLFAIKSVAAPPPPLLLPAEEPPREPRGVLATLLVLVVGAVLGAGTLLGGLYLARPAFVRSLLGLGSSHPTTAVVRGAAKAPPASAAIASARPAPDAAPPRVAAAPRTEPVEEKKAEEKPAVATAADPPKKIDDKKLAVAKAEKSAPAEKSAAPAKTAKKAAAAKRVAALAKRKRGKRAEASEDIDVVDPGAGETGSRAAKKSAKGEDAGEEKPEPTPPSKAESGEAKKAETKKAETKKGKKSTTEELDSLIDAATDGKPPPKKQEEKAEAKKEEKKPAPGLSRDQVAAGMKRAQSGVQDCNDKFQQTGMVTVEATIDGGSGRVGKGRVVGGFAGTAVGECVLQAVKRAAQFPKFGGGSVTVQYPFVLR